MPSSSKTERERWNHHKRLGIWANFNRRARKSVGHHQGGGCRAHRRWKHERAAGRR